MELHSNGNRITCFDSFGVKHISKEINKFTDILRDLQSQPIFLEYKDTIIELFDYWVMTDFMNLFSPKDVKNIDNKTLYYTKNG